MAAGIDRACQDFDIGCQFDFAPGQAENEKRRWESQRRFDWPPQFGEVIRPRKA